MDIDFTFEEHYNACAVTPAILIERGHCADPDCEESHYQASFSWLFWTVAVQF